VNASDGGKRDRPGLDIPRTWRRARQGRASGLPAKARRLTTYSLHEGRGGVPESQAAGLPTEDRRHGAHLVLASSAAVTPAPARRSHKRAGRVSRVDCRRAGGNLGLPETRKG
jgi:hypothetical protein